jgi:REP element-mobilizing transposase RayT/DNA-binding response OmpR family regulator
MQTPLLVVTSDKAFGELLRQGLEETERFNVKVTGQTAVAAAYLRESGCSLAFLDTSQLDGDPLEVGRQLRKANPDLKLVLVSEHGLPPGMDELAPQSQLTKPFYLPDLLAMMARLFPARERTSGRRESEAADKVEEEMPWLDDVNRAAQHLTRLTLESSAQAALITRESDLWAYAGQLPQAAAREVCETVSRYWDRQEESDLVRFVRLQTTNAEHMLYATRLAQGLVLALIFDAETPFSTIRSQVNNLVRSLSASPPEPEVKETDLSDEQQVASIAGILSSVPPPNPSKDQKPIPGISHIAGMEGALPQAPHFSRESSPVVRLAPAPVNEASGTRQHVVTEIDPMAVTRQHVVEKIEPDEVTRQSRPQKKKRETATAVTAETAPRSITEVARKIVLEPASPSVYNLTYACLLIPRFAHHHLTGDLADRIGEWVPEICIAFGWRLEQIAVRPEYLQWVTNVPPATSPGYLMRILRQHTSEKLFAEFPRFKRENPSGDFWAPGYLIMGGTNPPPPQLVKEFIAQTRQRQGISQQLR